MLAKLKIEPLEGITIPAPALGTVAQVSGTGTFVVTVDTLLMFNEDGGLDSLVEQLLEQGAEEDMVSAWPQDTGLDNAIKIIPGNPQHGPRIKIAIDPPDRFTNGGLTATIPFGEDSIGNPIPRDVVPAKIEHQLR